ncbi:MAG: bi-domain-containing oxidoreductase [Candidatus Cloacimonetes bacterium]|nr:bi-domain-containing oxidoreductase [Candidatus Cloacimonadota bacterium]
MKQLFQAAGRILVENVPAPTLDHGEVLVQVHFSLISTGTETSSMRKQAEMSFGDKVSDTMKKVDQVKTLVREKGLSTAANKVHEKLFSTSVDDKMTAKGYSNAGMVIDIGAGVTRFKPGDRVACAGSGYASHAEFVCVPENLVAHVDDSVDLQKAAFTTVGCIAMHGIRRAAVTPGEIVVISGLGLLGLIAVQIAKAWGLKVIGIDLKEHRLNLALDVGADAVFMADRQDLVQQCIAFTGGQGVDAVIVSAATSSTDPVHDGFEMCRRKGRVVIVGDVGMDLRRDLMYNKELDLLMSTSYGPGRYDSNYEEKGQEYPLGYIRWTENRNMQEFLHMLKVKTVDTSMLVHAVLPIERGAEAFKILVDERNSIAVLLQYSQEPEQKQSDLSKRLDLHVLNKCEGKIGVGVIGAGGFMSRNIIPHIMSLSDSCKVIGICNKTSASAKQKAKRYNADYATTDFREIIQDSNIDAVFIGTHHNTHAMLICEALAAGKHVFCEKPLAMNETQLDSILSALENSDRQLAVGFNRRYAPMIVKMREVISRKVTPVMVQYRVNAGHIPLSSWVQNEEIGGGRIIGEGCHFVDTISYLVDSRLVDIQVAGLPVNGAGIIAKDNYNVLLRFENGSVGSLLYTSLGGKSLEKERIEVFCHGGSLVLDNFMSLTCYNTGDKNISSRKMEKGFTQEIEQFMLLLQNKPNHCIKIDDIVSATRATFFIKALYE